MSVSGFSLGAAMRQQIAPAISVDGITAEFEMRAELPSSQAAHETTKRGGIVGTSCFG